MSVERLPLREVPVSCNRDCGAGCPLLARTKNGKLVEIIDHPEAPKDMSGCARGYRYPETVYHKDRLKKPLLLEGERGSGLYKEVSWEEGLDYTARRLDRLLQQYGSNAILHLGGSGSCRGAVHNTSRLPKRFFHVLGGYTGTDGNYSARAVRFAMPYLFGTIDTGFDPQTLESSELIILWGANISDTRFGSALEYWVLESKKRGVPVIVLDPRESRTVKRCATEWIQLFPGTDAAMMCAVLWVLIENGLTDAEFLHRCCVGFEEIKDFVMGRTDGISRTPEWAEGICGVSAETIRRFARSYGKAKPAALIPGLSIQRTIGGEEVSRLAAVLQSFTGNVGIEGGTSGGMAWVSLPDPECGQIPLNETGKTHQLPVYSWADWALEGREGGYPADIRGIYNVGGNYIIQGSDIEKNIRAFTTSDFSVCHELFLTATARYCDVIFPATTFLERRDVLFIGAHYLLFSERAIAPLGETKDDYEILSLLARRLGIERDFTEGRSGDDWVEWCIEKSEVQDPKIFRKTGIYDGGLHKRTAFSLFRENPQEHPLTTESGKIELSSKKYERETGFPAIPVPRFLPSEGQFPLRLITPHARFRVNSQNSNLSWCAEQEIPVVEMHPADCTSRSIADGEQVKVVSEHGSLAIAVKQTEEILPGVVSIHQGSWPPIAAEGFRHQDNPNFCTSSVPTQPSKGSRTHSTWVEVVKV